MNTIRSLKRPRFTAPPFGSRESDWRSLSASEIKALRDGNNQADDWANLKVREGFNPERVENCRFFGTVRISALSPSYLEYHDLCLPVGLRNCTIISCDLGDNVAIENVSYMSHMVVSEMCLVFNVNELIGTDHAKFGNVLDGEDEAQRIWLEIANENGGRRVLSFDGMLPADAWLWSKFRDDRELQERFVQLTDRIGDKHRGCYGVIGERSVIKNCRILKDLRIGENAYINGVNKLKNLTINSDSRRPTQLGEGIELINGIIGFGCQVYGGVKADRFILNDHSNLKYGARLINSLLGPNSTVSGSEVLNTLIFASHEQHHASSFLCASVFKGQSNMAAAAIIGSNHNSRAPDGEIVAERGFWPALSVSLKHNSRFSAFCLIAKGAYPHELDIPLPFTLIANDESAGELLMTPGYWFRCNMYALFRNAAKSVSRDKRQKKALDIEYDWLAPDTVDQMRKACHILESWADDMGLEGKAVFETEEDPKLHAGPSYPVEAGNRPVRVLCAGRAWKDYRRFIKFYAVRTILIHQKGKMREKELQETGWNDSWENIGGQLMALSDLNRLKNRIKSKEITSWKEVHRQYQQIAANTVAKRLSHARFVLGEISDVEPPVKLCRQDITEAQNTAEFILTAIIESRRKDYENHFRNITFENAAERDAVVGPLDENEILKEAKRARRSFQKMSEEALKNL